MYTTQDQRNDTITAEIKDLFRREGFSIRQIKKLLEKLLDNLSRSINDMNELRLEEVENITLKVHSESTANTNDSLLNDLTKIMEAASWHEQLQFLPKIHGASITIYLDNDFKTFTTHEYVNGKEFIGLTSLASFQEALYSTKFCVEQILKEHKNVFVRVMPELTRRNDEFQIYMRLAY